MSEAIDGLRRRLFPVGPGRYLLGLSGGADSVAMLLMLLPEIRNGKIILEAVHVNHGLRGEESDKDEAFCTELCRKEGIPIHLFRAELHGRTDEASARKARFSFLSRQYEECGADALILAHHTDDQAETFVMRLLRGAGADGLECMKHEETVNGIHILRPMLRLRREEIRLALTADGYEWREDSSNNDPAFFRNRIRTELIPAMSCMAEDAVDKICRAAGLIAQDNETLNAQAYSLLERYASDTRLDAESLAMEFPALRSRVLRMWWNMHGPELKEHTLSLEQTTALDRLLFAPKGKVNLPADMHAVRAGGYLFLQGKTGEIPDPVPFKSPGTRFGEYRLEATPSEGNPGDGKIAQEIPEGFADGCVIRTRRPGDRIRPFGCSGSRKLQDYLTDRKVAEPFRDKIPLLCRDNEILLVCGVGAGNIPAWDRNTKQVRLTWHGEMPWTE